MSDTVLEEQQPLDVKHTGGFDTFWPLVLKNALLTILTLTFYRFWARTHVRRYLWRYTRFLDEPFEYTGTGKELFLGFLLVLVVFILPVVLLQVVISLLSGTGESNQFLDGSIGIVILFLVGFAGYRAQRYRLSRTLWRGIRGSMDGSAALYGLLYLGFTILNAVTLGLTYPISRFALFKIRVADITIGDGSPRVTGSFGALYPRFLIAWLLIILLLGGALALFFMLVIGSAAESVQEMTAQIYLAALFSKTVLLILVPVLVVYFLILSFYRAREFGWMASCVQYQGLRFALETSTASLFGLLFGNFLITIATLGLGYPFAQLRAARYFCGRLAVTGSLDVEAIRQSAAKQPAIGEGLADAFDLGAV